MVRKIAVTFAALILSGTALSACGTVMDGASEDVRINIAGTGEALCDVTQPGRRYRAYAPSTFRVMRSKDDLRVRCLAPGNREQVFVLKSTISDKEPYNLATLGLGAAWDYQTGGMYTYPDTVLVDFTTTPAKSYPLPDYQQVFNRNPELLQMEEFRPGTAALTSDIGTAVPTMQKRTGDEDNSMGIMMPSASSSTPGAVDKAPSTTVAAPVAAPVTVPATNPVSPKPGVAASPTTSRLGTTTTTTTNGAPTPGATSNATSTTSSGTSTTHLFTNKVGTLPSSASQ